MNDQGLLLIYRNRLNNPLAWDLFECLSDQERDRIWDLLYNHNLLSEAERIDGKLNLIKEEKS